MNGSDFKRKNSVSDFQIGRSLERRERWRLVETRHTAYLEFGASHEAASFCF
jgi:hypothetical protein